MDHIDCTGSVLGECSETRQRLPKIPSPLSLMGHNLWFRDRGLELFNRTYFKVQFADGEWTYMTLKVLRKFFKTLRF